MNIKKIVPLIGIGILIYILSTINFQTMMVFFVKPPLVFTILACFAIFPVILLSTIQWQLLLRQQKIHVSFWYSCKNIFIGYFYGFISPGGFGGYIRSVYLSAKSKTPLPKCVANLITFNTIDYITLLLFGLFGAFLLSDQAPYLFLPMLIVFIVSIVVFIFFLTQKTSKLLFSRIIESQVFRVLKNRLEDPLESFYVDLPLLHQVLPVFFISFIGWFLRFILFYLIAELFSIHVPILQGMMIIAVADIIASIPISIYGLGTREAALVSLYSFYNISRDAVVGLSLFWFTATWLLPSIIGAGITLLERKNFSSKKIFRSL